MIKYILRRIALIIPVMLGVTVVVFTLMYITPGDPVDTMLAGDQATSKETKEALREELGLNKGYLVRLVDYIINVCKGDLGFDYNTRVPVVDRIKETFPNTVLLAMSATLFAVIVGITLGVISAVKQYTFFDTASSVIAIIGNSMPSFWEGLLLMMLFSLTLGWLPSIGFTSVKHLIMPAIVTGTHSLAAITRITRSSMLEVIRSDYISTARAKGQKEIVVILRHCLKNALIPVVTTIGIQFGTLLGGSVVTEAVFAFPGLGSMMITAIKGRNYMVVQGSVLLVALTLCIINLIVDLLYAFIDPRIRSQYQ